MTQAAAQALAEGFLAGYLPGASVLEGTAFPGYYTFDFGRGEVEGMLSVNAATGEVWVHTWHGPALSDEAHAAPSCSNHAGDRNRGKIAPVPRRSTIPT